MEDFLPKVEDALLWTVSALALLASFAALFRERLIPVLRRIVGLTPTKADDRVVEKLDEILRAIEGEPEIEASVDEDEDERGPYDA